MKIVNCLLVFGMWSESALSDSIVIAYDKLGSMLEEKNAHLKAARLEFQAAQDREGSLARSFMPSLEVQGAQESFRIGSSPVREQPSFGAELKVNLLNGGQDQIEGKIRALDSERKDVLMQQTYFEQLQEVRKLYWEILASQKFIALVETSIKVNEANLSAAERRIRSGVATESDRFEFQMKGVDLKRNLAEAKLNMTKLRRDFAILFDIKDAKNLVFPDQMDHNHDFETDLVHNEKDHEFLYKDGELKSQQAEMKAISQRRVWWPQLEAFAAYNQYTQRIEAAGPDARSDERNESVFGVRLKFSLPNALDSAREATAFSKEAVADLARAQLVRSQVEAHIAGELEQLRFLHDQVHDADENIQRAEKYYKLTQSEYSRGVKNSPDVLGAAERLFENQSKRLELIKEFQLAKVHVLAKLGR